MNKLYIGTIFVFSFLFSNLVQANICDRTPQVVAEIERQVGKKCQNITSDDLLKITYIDLGSEGIYNLTANSFEGLKSLQNLYIYNNQLTSLPENLFKGLSSLQELNLYKNQLTSLPENIFQDLSSLTILKLKGNHLISLPQYLFQGLSSLVFIYLDNNRLTSLPDNLFQGLRSLESLHINNNQLTSLHENIFQGLISLKELVLEYNQLTSLPDYIFQGLSSLEFLWLNYNQLTSLPENIFQGLSSINEIYIKGNPTGLTQTWAYQKFIIFNSFPLIKNINLFNMIDGLINYHQNITQVEEFTPMVEAYIKWDSVYRSPQISYQYYSLYDLIPHADNVAQINIVRQLAVDVCALVSSFCPVREEIHQFPMKTHLEATIRLKNELISSQAPASTISKVQALINGLQDFFSMKLDYVKLKPNLSPESISQLDQLFSNTNPSLNQIADSILNLHNLINANSKNKEWINKYALTTLKVKSYLQFKFKELFWSITDGDKIEVVIALTKVSEGTALLTPAESKSIQKLIQQGSLTKAIQRSIEWQLAKLSREYETNLATLSETDIIRRKNFFDTYNYQVRTSIITEWDKL
ncbi:MAG: leucine-rich repeat domain-containing protein [Bacteriovoracaceae bacterium]